MTDLVWLPVLLALILLLAIAALKLHEQPRNSFDDFVSGGGSFSRSLSSNHFDGRAIHCMGNAALGIVVPGTVGTRKGEGWAQSSNPGPEWSAQP